MSSVDQSLCFWGTCLNFYRLSREVVQEFLLDGYNAPCLSSTQCLHPPYIPPVFQVFQSLKTLKKVTLRDLDDFMINC